MSFRVYLPIFSRFRFYLALLFVLVYSVTQSQDHERSSDSAINDRETKELLNKYLSGSDSAESKIISLVGLAYDDGAKGNFSSQIKKMQIALILEKSVMRPCRATFELNQAMGHIFMEISVPYAIQYFNKAISISLRTTEPTESFVVYNILAGLYLKQNDHTRVLDSYASAMKAAVPLGTVSIASVNNNIGWFYSKIGKNDSAMVYLKKALSYYDPKTTDDDLYSNILENIARIEERNGNYKSALEIYRFNENFYRRQNMFPDFVGNRVNMMRAQNKLALGNIKQSIDSLSPLVDLNKNTISNNDVLRFYKFCYDYYIEKKDISNASLYHEKYNDYRELISKKDVEKLITLTKALLSVQSIAYRSEYEIYRHELEAAKESSNKNKVIASLFLISAVLIFITLFIYIQKRKKELEITRKVAAAELKAKELEAKAIKADLENARLQAEADIQKKEIERQHIVNEFERERLFAKTELETRDFENRAIQNELELKKKDLTNVILHNTQVYEANKEIISRLQEVSRNKSDISGALNSLLMDLKSQNQVADRLSSLQNNIDHLSTEFYTKLKARFPDLTKSEVELCGYILINLSTKDISILKNVETASVKMSKTRLRKKLGLSPDQDLEGLLKTI